MIRFASLEVWVFDWDFTLSFDIWDSVIDMDVRFFSCLAVKPLNRCTVIPFIAFGSLVETRPLDFGLGASQVETIGFLSGILLHYSLFGVLHSIFC